MGKPRRRVQIELRMGADSWDEATDSLRQIALEIDMGHLRGTSISGGYAAGYVFEASEDETVTHDSYVEENSAYVRSPEFREASDGE